MTENYFRVIKLLNNYQVIVNGGTINGIDLGDTFTVFRYDDEEIVDPLTEESLGRMEILVGTGTIVHVQERFAVLESNQYGAKEAVTVEGKPYIRYQHTLTGQGYRKPFNNIALHDYLRDEAG